jgi:hypothetical protein
MLCTEPKAITLGNKESLAFYRAWMELTGRPNREGIPVIENYAGPGQDRVVLRRKLSQGGAPCVSAPDQHDVRRHEEHVRTQGSPQKAEFIAG